MRKKIIKIKSTFCYLDIIVKVEDGRLYLFSFLFSIFFFIYFFIFELRVRS